MYEPPEQGVIEVQVSADTGGDFWSLVLNRRRSPYSGLRYLSGTRGQRTDEFTNC